MRHDRRPPARPAVLLGLRRSAPSAVAGPAAKPGPVTVYVGTYTDGRAAGSTASPSTPPTGATTEPVLAVETKNPSFLALHPSGRFLYAVGEIESFEGAKTGAVSAFAVDPKTGDLTLLNQQASEGTGPCHLVVDRRPQRAGRQLRRRHGGRAADRRGRPAEPASSVAQTTRAPGRTRAGRRSRTRTASTSTPRSASRWRWTSARIASSSTASTRRRAQLEPHGAAALEPGSGPRHLAFDPSGRHLYVDQRAAVDDHAVRLRRRAGHAAAAADGPHAARRLHRDQLDGRGRGLARRALPLRLEPRPRLDSPSSRSTRRAAS